MTIQTWQPLIAVANGFDKYGLEQARVIKFDIVNSKSVAWDIAKFHFNNTPDSVSFTINKV